MKKYSIVIPVYNSTTSLPIIVNKINGVFIDIEQEYEVIFVDDYSSNPLSWQTLTEIAETNAKVKIIRLTRNFGQQSATLCGISHAVGDYIITMDDDLQHAPEDIPRLIEQENHDIVIGEFEKKHHPFLKRLTSKLKGYFDHFLIGKPLNIQLTSFRLFNRIIADGILNIKTSYPFIPAMMFYVSKDVVGVKVSHSKRIDGKSNYNLKKLLALFSNLIINNSSFLLKSIGYIGFITSISSFLLAIYFIYEKMTGSIQVAGWTSNVVIILFIGGLILFSLGIIGDYLIRIISGVEHKPTFLIRDSKNV